MTNPTSNYSFQMPTSTDLVTDLPADFEVFGQAVDTRLKALQPGTTLGDLAYSSATANTNTRLPIGTNGQVLAVVGGVPAWQNGTTGDIEGVTAGVGISGGGTSGTVTITNSMATAITTAGDLIKGTGAGTFDRLGIGSTGQVLTVSSGAPAWVTPGGATKNYTQIASASLSGASYTVSGLAGYDDVWVFIRSASGTTATPSLYFRYNGSATNIHNAAGFYYGGNATSPYYAIPSNFNATNEQQIFCASTTTAAGVISGYFRFTGCNTSGKKMMQHAFGVTAGQYQEATHGGGFVDTTATISSVEVYLNAGTFDAGTIVVMAAA